jgi:hypothetical protein
VRDESLHILQHALGLDDYGRGSQYRNHYVTGPKCDGWDLCQQHVEAGRMICRGPGELFGGDYCLQVTEAGKAFVRQNSPKPPRLSRSKKRYLKWLEISESAPDLTFGEFLKNELGYRHAVDFP